MEKYLSAIFQYSLATCVQELLQCSQTKTMGATRACSDTCTAFDLVITDFNISPTHKLILFATNPLCRRDAGKPRNGTCNGSFVQRCHRSRSGFLSEGNHSGGIVECFEATPGSVVADLCPAAHERRECKVTRQLAIIPHR